MTFLTLEALLLMDLVFSKNLGELYPQVLVVGLMALSVSGFPHVHAVGFDLLQKYALNKK